MFLINNEASYFWDLFLVFSKFPITLQFNFDNDYRECQHWMVEGQGGVVPCGFPRGAHSKLLLSYFLEIIK